MSTCPRRCENLSVPGLERESVLADKCRFVDCEKWRADTKLDETVPTWDYPEKEQLFEYYPQYYHKTDKVRTPGNRGGFLWGCLCNCRIS